MHTTATPSRTKQPLDTRSKIALGAGATLAAGALAFGGLAATTAFFTSQASVSGSVTAASVAIEADTAAASTPINVTDLLPGDTVSSTIDLENTGNTGVYYRISLPREAGGSDDLAAALNVTVTAGSTTTTQTLSAWQTGHLQVGSALAGGADQEVTVSVALAANADSDLQGALAAFSVQFDAIQERHTDAPTAGWTLNDAE